MSASPLSRVWQNTPRQAGHRGGDDLLFNHTESVVLMVACHAMYDVVAIGVVPLAGTMVPLLAFGLSAAVLALLAGLLAVLSGPQLGRQPDPVQLPA